MRGFRGEIDTGAGDAGQGAQRLFHPAGTGGAAHPGDGEIESLGDRHDLNFHKTAEPPEQIRLPIMGRSRPSFRAALQAEIMVNRMVDCLKLH
jgi:hypothetical protein